MIKANNIVFSLVRNKNTKSFLQLKTNTKSQRWFGVWHCNLEIGRQLSQEYYTWNDFKTVFKYQELK